jgi:hypothetical protein
MKRKKKKALQDKIRLGAILAVGVFALATTAIGHRFIDLSWRVATPGDLLWELVAAAFIGVLMFRIGSYALRVGRRLAWYVWYFRNTGWQGLKARLRRPRANKLIVPPDWTDPRDKRSSDREPRAGP